MANTKDGTNVTDIESSEVQALKKDYAELKTLIAKIQDDLKATGSKKIHDIQDTGREQMEHLEDKVREKPITALTVAFGVGFLASSFMSR